MARGRRFGPRRFSPGEYAAVTRAVSADALRATLHYIGELRRRDRVRSNLRAVAFLERFETAVAHELDRRLQPLPQQWQVVAAGAAESSPPRSSPVA